MHTLPHDSNLHSFDSVCWLGVHALSSRQVSKQERLKAP